MEPIPLVMVTTSLRSLRAMWSVKGFNEFVVACVVNGVMSAPDNRLYSSAKI
jgi:hypothetical protein